MQKFCKRCNKEIIGRNKQAIFCSDNCGDVWHHLNVYYPKNRKRLLEKQKEYIKNNPEAKKRKREAWYRWWKRNKVQHAKDVYAYRRRDVQTRYKDNSRLWVSSNKDKIKKLIGASCIVCGFSPCHYHHTKYFTFKQGSAWAGKSIAIKENLLPVCRQHHQEIHDTKEKFFEKYKKELDIHYSKIKIKV